MVKKAFCEQSSVKVQILQTMTWSGGYYDSRGTAITVLTLRQITHLDMEEFSIGMLVEAALVMGLTMFLTHWLLKPVLESIFAMVSHSMLLLSLQSHNHLQCNLVVGIGRGPLGGHVSPTSLQIVIGVSLKLEVSCRDCLYEFYKFNFLLLLSPLLPSSHCFTLLYIPVCNTLNLDFLL